MIAAVRRVRSHCLPFLPIGPGVLAGLVALVACTSPVHLTPEMREQEAVVRTASLEWQDRLGQWDDDLAEMHDWSESRQGLPGSDGADAAAFATARDAHEQALAAFRKPFEAQLRRLRVAANAPEPARVASHAASWKEHQRLAGEFEGLAREHERLATEYAELQTRFGAAR